MKDTLTSIVICLCANLAVYISLVSGNSEIADDYGVLYPTSCEVCKYLAVELEASLEKTGKSHDIIETGYALDPAKKKKKKYAQSELRLIESLDGICERILEYNIHKERKDSTRFAKGMSETFQTLEGLVSKGVKVDLGIPHELWHKPSVEVTTMKTQCESLVEKHEADIEEWYFYNQDIPLSHFLCTQRALKKGDDGCISEVVKHRKKKKEQSTKKKKREKQNDDLVSHHIADTDSSHLGDEL